MKVLVSAYACEPGGGSEPGAGWAWVRAAALHHEVWLLTRANNAPLIEEALAREGGLRLHPVYLDLPAHLRRWKRGSRGVHLYYLLWQALALREGRRLEREHHFDVAHHLTFAVDWMPAAVAWIPGVPLVWGPVGGSARSPRGLWHWLGLRGAVREVVREGLTRVMRRVAGDPTARRAAIVVAQNREVLARFRASGLVALEPNVALDLPALGQGGRGGPESPRAAYAGRLLPLKGLRLALDCLARPELAAWSLDIFGDGPEREALQRRAKRSGVEARVAFHGQRPREEVRRAIASADAFLFPSLHDAAGWSVGEALVAGTPVVCLDRGGPAVLVESGPGIAVASQGDVVAGLARALAAAPALATAEATRSARATWSSGRLPELVDSLYRIASSSGVQQGSRIAESAAPESWHQTVPAPAPAPDGGCAAQHTRRVSEPGG